MNFRHMLWHLGVDVERCPYCRKTLLEHGFFPRVSYTCPDEGCRFNLPNK